MLAKSLLNQLIKQLEQGLPATKQAWLSNQQRKSRCGFCSPASSKEVPGVTPGPLQSISKFLPIENCILDTAFHVHVSLGKFKLIQFSNFNLNLEALELFLISRQILPYFPYLSLGIAILRKWRPIRRHCGARAQADILRSSGHLVKEITKFLKNTKGWVKKKLWQR